MWKSTPANKRKSNKKECPPEIQNSNIEIRNKSEIRNSKRKELPILVLYFDISFSCFGFVSDFVFRISNFRLQVKNKNENSFYHPEPAAPAVADPGGHCRGGLFHAAGFHAAR